MTAPRPEPQTEAGWRLLRDIDDQIGDVSKCSIRTWIADTLPDIEREARAPLAARMREAVEALPMRTNTWWEDGRVVVASEINRDAVLAVLDVAPDAAPALDYESRVQAMADALHEDCRLEWQAIRVVDPVRAITQHGADAHYGEAHDLVRRLWPDAAPRPEEPETVKLPSSGPHAAGTLDAAWAEVERALPEGWAVELHGGWRFGRSPEEGNPDRRYYAVALGPHRGRGRARLSEDGAGPTSAAALLALVARLRVARPGSDRG